MYQSPWPNPQVALQLLATVPNMHPRILPPSSPLMQMPLPQEATVEISDSDDEEDNEKLRTLFCANLDERVTEDLLYEVFLQAGPIEEVRIPKDGGGKRRTFGFVTYAHTCTPPYAMQLFQGLRLFRKPITIKYQNSTSVPQSPMRRSINDSDQFNRIRNNSYDNSSLRAANYAAFLDVSHDYGLNGNPFRHETLDWTKGNSLMNREHGRDRDRDRDRKAKHILSRPHYDSKPYQRSDDRDHDRHRHGNEHLRRHHHNGSNRNSEQRHRGRYTQ